MTNAGALREVVQLQNPPAIDDDAGGQTGGWTLVATLRAEVLAQRGDEAVQAAIETSVVQYKVRLRRRAITSGQRLLWNGLALDVRAVLPDHQRQFVSLLCDAVLQ